MSMALVTVPSRPDSTYPSPDAEHVGPPGIHAGDGETDLDILKSLPKQFEVRDEESANWLVRRVMESRRYATQVKEWAEREVRRAAREEQTLLYLFGRQIETWTKVEVTKLNGRRKSLNLPAGCVGFRALPSKIVIDNDAEAIKWAKEHCPQAVVVVEKLAKIILDQYVHETGHAPEDGVHVELASERFFIR